MAYDVPCVVLSVVLCVVLTIALLPYSVFKHCTGIVGILDVAETTDQH